MVRRPRHTIDSLHVGDAVRAVVARVRTPVTPATVSVTAVVGVPGVDAHAITGAAAQDCVRQTPTQKSPSQRATLIPQEIPTAAITTAPSASDFRSASDAVAMALGPPRRWTRSSSGLTQA